MRTASPRHLAAFFLASVIFIGDRLVDAPGVIEEETFQSGSAIAAAVTGLDLVQGCRGPNSSELVNLVLQDTGASIAGVPCSDVSADPICGLSEVAQKLHASLAANRDQLLTI